MTGIIHDIRYALRQLRKSPGFTLTAVLVLALGIGANTAIYTLLDQALLRRLPVKEANRLVLFRFSGSETGSTHSRGDTQIYFSYPMYRDLRDHNTVLSGLIATDFAQVGVQWHNQPELADAELVSGNYFDTLGVQPALGRLVVPSDDLVQNANPVVVLSFNYWRGRFGLDPRILNQTIGINGHPFVVIGVAAPGFRSVVAGDNPALFVPMMMKPEITPGWNDLDERRSKWLNIVGRLKPEISRQKSQAAMDALWRSIRAEELKQMGRSPQEFKDAFLTKARLFLDDGSRGVPIHGTVPTTLLVVIAMSGLLALMACTNVASLLLVRVATRTRETSVRYALGANQARIVRQLLSEGVLLGVAGGVVGALLAPPIAALLIRMVWQEDRLAITSHPDLRILAFNFVLALFVSVLFSLAPILQTWRPDVTTALKQQGAVVAGGSHRLRRVTVAGQIALSLSLLVGAGLFVRTLHNLRSVEIGFATDHLVTFHIDARLAGYETKQVVPLYQQILESLSGLPGVRSAAATNDPELANNNWSYNITISGYKPAEHENMDVEWARVSAGYFLTLQMPLLAGRALTEADAAGTQKVAVVSEHFARRFFADPGSAIGHYFCSGAGNVKPDIEIVGIAKDAKHMSLRDTPHSTVFTPLRQEQDLHPLSIGMTFYVRTWQDPKSAEATIRQGMHTLDPNLVLDDLRTMQEQVDQNLMNERVIALLALSFGVLAALMAAIGVYGVVAYSTAQRTREIGVRIAMGATRAAVVRMILREVLWLAGIGVATGLPLSILLARAARSQLYGISSQDPLTLSFVCLAIAAVAFASAAIPARRAAKVDPMVALRYE